MTKKQKKGFNDIMLDIVGWIMLGLSLWKIFTIEDATIAKFIPYLVVGAVGIVFVALTIKKVGVRALDELTKFTKRNKNNEEDIH